MNRFSKILFTVTTIVILSVTAAVATEDALVHKAKQKAVSVRAPASFDLSSGVLYLFGGVVKAHGETEEERSIAIRRAKALAWRHMASRAVAETALAALSNSDKLVVLLEKLPLWHHSTKELAVLPYRQSANAEGCHLALLILSVSQFEELKRNLQKELSLDEVEKLFMLHSIGLAYDARRDGRLVVARRHFEDAFARQVEPPTDAVMDYCRILASQGEAPAALRILDGLWNLRRHSLTSEQKQQFFELRGKVSAQ